ncbi:N6-adenosine-specific RNA methylase IME4 [Bradyrhizobium brasilense]|uniref:N6-adenosine-specific RNA methylase IME4 n=1 Tax=Bradyrhizobium brasilense TaxID=1419277 RepID=A0A1G6ING8_9BRAD|nr:MT-A70 family methyltransferase [Bradyrhizobium brasilense]SDC08048.1 N6-adenosine-specific RNA methylase IME4 [Bradyrhizobium brasilense]
MTLLAAYDRARVALAEATRVDQVLAVRDELAHVKLYAKQIQDRALLADATVIQMRSERRLGVLLAAAKEAGQIAEGRRANGVSRNAKGGDADDDRVTLKEIGVDKKLSTKAQKAAALDDDAFEQLAETAREKIRSGGAILVDPITSAAKEAELAGRRQAHAERTKDGGSIADLGRMVAEGRKFGSIGSDPQWKFLTRSAAGEGRSANIHYKTEEVTKIKDLPVGQLLADDGAFYMWMVDWCPQDALDLLTHWGLKHVTTAFTWIKTNGDDADLDIWDKSTWHMGQGYWTRANPEQCWLATKGNPKRLFADVRQLIVAPVMEHSRKPDEWLDRIERLTGGDYLELQARRTRPGWVSWGDELEFTGRAA